MSPNVTDDEPTELGENGKFKIIEEKSEKKIMRNRLSGF